MDLVPVTAGEIADLAATSRAALDRNGWGVSSMLRRRASFAPAGLHKCSMPVRGVLYKRMLTARAAIRSTVTAEIVDSAAINALAGRVSGMASVGLNAVAFVNER